MKSNYVTIALGYSITYAATNDTKQLDWWLGDLIYCFNEASKV